MRLFGHTFPPEFHAFSGGHIKKLGETYFMPSVPPSLDGSLPTVGPCPRPWGSLGPAKELVYLEDSE